MKKLFLILLFTISLFHTSLFAQWVQQTLPVSGLVYDIAFFDANTGLVSMDTPALLRTTNGGTNWIVVSNFISFHLEKIDGTTLYATGRRGLQDKIYRTTNTGLSWDTVAVSNDAYRSMSFINKDTGWVSGFNNVNGTVWRTTDGGQTLQTQFTFGGSSIQKIFFTKQNYSGNYYGWYTVSGLMFKTTNSGANWTQYTNMPGNNASFIFFMNKDTGWVTNANGSQNYTMYTTNNGGNWLVQNLPSNYGAGDLFFYNHLYGFWGGGFGKVTVTTNSGFNWGYQNAPFFTVDKIFFIDNLTGWCGGNGVAKTTNGGGNITYIGIQQISSDIPTQYKLEQNYPNPFNAATNFNIQIPKSGFVKLIIFDMLGRIIKTEVNDYLNAGTYKINFEANNFSSGVYFYKLTADSYTETKKMILIK